MKTPDTPQFAAELNLDEPTFATPREYINAEIDSIFTTVLNCCIDEQADSTLKMRLEVIRDHAQKAIDMMNRIEGAQQHELYIDQP